MPFNQQAEIQFRFDYIIRQCQVILGDLSILIHSLEAGHFPLFPPPTPIIDLPEDIVSDNESESIIFNPPYQSEWSESMVTLVDNEVDSPFMDSFEFDPVITSDTEGVQNFFYRPR
jgi:hypothetical protein